MLGAVLALVLLPTLASAQRVTVGNITAGDAIAVRCVTVDGAGFESCAGAGGDVTIGSVDQGTGGVSPWAVNFLAPQHIICDSGCGSAAAVAMADATANPTIPQTAGFGMLFNGVTWDRWRGDTTNGAWVNVKNALTVTANQGGTWSGVGVTGTFWPTTAGSPSSARLSDGAAFYDARAIRALTSSDQVTVANATLAVTESGTWTVQPGNTANTTAWLVTGTGGTFPTSPPANASTNVAQVAGTTADTNSGLKSGGTLRVVLATDQPALTNKLLVTPDSVALPANQSVNVSQLAGTTTDTNSGVKSAGTLRVVLATDQPALTNKLLVTPDSVALPANQSVNTAQFGGTNVSTGVGAAGAGIPRVTISNDSSLAANQSVNLNQLAGNAVSSGVGASGTGTLRTATLIHDGTDTAQVTATSGGSLQVECSAGCGSAATVNTVHIEANESVAAPTAATWYIKKQWALPSSAHAIPTRAFSIVTTAAGSRTLFAVINSLGTLNLGTNAFAAVNSVASPFFYGRLFGCVTTVMSATVDTLTVTYTDELGAASTSGAVVFASASPVGNCFEFPLAVSSGPVADSGARAVTNVTDTAATTGVVTVYGVTSLYESIGTVTTDQSPDLATGELNANEQIAILLIQAATTAQQRSEGITLSLR